MENSEGPPPEDWEVTQRTFGGHYVVNWSNPFVQEAYRKALAHWIDLGVDGIYMKHMDKMHVIDKRDIPGIIRQWRGVLDTPRRQSSSAKKDLNVCGQASLSKGSTHHSMFGSNPSNSNQPTKTPETTAQCLGRRILIVSSKFVDDLATDLGRESPELDVVQKNVDVLDRPLLVGSGEEMSRQVSGLGGGWCCGPVPMWHLGSADTFRVASRIEPRYQMAAFYLLMALPGATSVLYGDEIGLKDSFDLANGRVSHPLLFID